MRVLLRKYMNRSSKQPPMSRHLICFAVGLYIVGIIESSTDMCCHHERFNSLLPLSLSPQCLRPLSIHRVSAHSCSCLRLYIAFNSNTDLTSKIQIGWRLLNLFCMVRVQFYTLLYKAIVQ